METDHELDEPNQESSEGGATGELIQVVYDPVLKCYFDPINNQYYQLK